MGIIRNIANLFKSTDAKLERIGAIEFELEQLQEVKDLIVDQYNTLSKAVSCEDFMCKGEVRFTDKDYVRQLASIKSTEKSLLKELDILKSSEDVIHRYDEDKRAEAVKIVKSLYRSGKLDLSQYNHAAAEKDENGAVKYADVIVVTDSWELLLMKRSNFEDKHQGAFVIPGGHVDKGEDYETAAKRELLEETGISVDKLKADEHFKDITFQKVGEFIDKNAHIEYYLLRINNKEQVEILLDELETRDYNWVPRDEIDNYQMVFNMKDNIKEIMGWDLLPNLKVIEKAFELGIIPADVLEKARAHKYISREGMKGNYQYTYDDSRNKLYHVTNTDYIFDILEDNKVKQKGNYFGVSLTRDKNYSVRGVSEGDVILVFDKEALSHNKKIISKADLNAKHSSKTGARSEAEERVEGDIELGKSLLEIRISKFNFDKYTKILEDSKNYLEDLRNSRVNLPEDMRLLRIKSYEKRLEYYGKLVNHPKLSVMDDIRKSFLEEIEKSFNSTSEEYLKGEISDELYTEAKGKYDSIEKAGKKDLTKLKKIKKLFMREGKLVFGTFWVDDSINEYDESKVSLSAGPINEDISQGDVMIVSTKKRTIQGTVCGFSFDKKEARHWISLLTEEGKVEWVEVNSMTNYTMVSKFTQGGKYKVIKSLGGSTGAMLVEDEYGNKYVKKTGKDKDHIRTEYQALLLYKMLGIDVPNVKEFDKENGILYTEYIDGNIPLKKFVEEVYKLGSAKEIIGQDFAVDALLGNWDVVGLEYDNILYGYNDDMHTGYFRVDVGGSLNKRAQGEDKVFGPQVPELDTLLDSSINPQTAFMFEGVDVQKALKRAVGKYEGAKNFINMSPHISQEIKDMLERRIAYMKSKIEPPKRSELNYKGKLYNVIPGYHPKEVVDFYDRLNQDLVITEDDIEVLGSDSDSKWTESKAAQFFISYFKGTNHLVNTAIANGVSYLDLWSLREYTSHSGWANDVTKEYTDSMTGNVNFDNSIFDGDEEGFEDKKIVLDIPVNSYFETLLSAVKSINAAKDAGKMAGDANQSKLMAASNVRDQIDEFKKDVIKDPHKFSTVQWERIMYLEKIYNHISEALGKNKKISVIGKPDGFNDFSISETQKVKKAKNPLNKSVVNIKGFEGQNAKSVAKVKILCNAIAKLEDILDPVFHVEGLLNRGIQINGDKQKQFAKEHGVPNKYVMHQWGSSTSWNEKGYQHGTQLRIIGEGVHINSISKYEGEESEVLLRPFTLFKTISMKDTYEKDGQAEVHLMKII
jgi:8-oxo-dGTP pyrophosphatase MutT (NUDIX family)